MSHHNLNDTFTPIKSSSLLPPISGAGTGRGRSMRGLQTSDGLHKFSNTLQPIQKSSLYQQASYDDAVQYEHTQCYRKKITNFNNKQKYIPLQVCGSNSLLKQSGLGVYLYLKFLWSLMITFILMSAVSLFSLIVNYSSSGLSKYSPSFSIKLASFTLGNLAGGDKTAYLMITFADIVNMIIFFIFYVYWRSFQNNTVLQTEEDPNIINPKLYALSVVGFYSDQANSVKQKMNEQALEKLIEDYLSFDSKDSIYQISIVYDYKGYFDYFIEYEGIIQTEQKEKHLIQQISHSLQKYQQLKKEREDVQTKLVQISYLFEPIYAIVHFKTLQSKQKFINYCKKYHLQDTFTQNFTRCICCVQPPSSQINLLIRSNNLSRPEQINWRNVDLTKFSVFIRWIFSIFLVIIFIVITSAIIVLCIVVVASQSSCQDVLIPLTTSATDAQAAVTAGGKVLFCYCNENFQQMYINSNVGQACSNISAKVLMTNALQIAASIISLIINFILSILVTIIAKYLLRTDTIPKEHTFVFWVIFISNFINSCLLPLILNGNIFGVTSIAYLKFIPFMNSSMSAFNDFNTDWYAMVSPYYLNLIIISTFISPVISLIISCLKHFWTHRKVKNLCENEDKENPAIQKEANNMITRNQFSLAEEQSQLVLILFIVIMYSGLIPLMIPIFTVGLIVWYYCKRAEIVRFSVRVPADESLSKSTLKLIPFMILAHALFSIWSHTSAGIFTSDSYLIQMNYTYFNSSLDRIFKDILITGEAAVIALIIIFNFTIINFVGSLIECCKDELEMPTQFGKVKTQAYGARIQNSNILKSYNIRQNPQCGSAFTNFRGLTDTKKRPAFREQFS